MNEASKKPVPAYTTYTAFSNLIKDLRENGMPSHITRSVVKGSNSGKATMMASLKYLDLIDKASTPTPMLAQLVDNEDNYNNNLKKLLETKYSFLFNGDTNITTATTEKVAEKFKAAGCIGSTVSKSISFFLVAAKAAGIEVSPRVKAPPVAKSPAKRKLKKSADTTGSGGTQEPEEDVVPEGMERITVSLRGMDDGIIYFPENMAEEDAKRAIKMTTFILKEFYGIDD